MSRPSQTSAWRRFSLAPILTFGGAITVAIIAAVTAGLRQRRQLEGERERLALQLEHERRLEDLRHLRDFLDEAAAFESAAENYLRFVGLVRSGPVEPPEYEERCRDALRAIVAVAGFNRRLRLRFPESHPVASEYDAVRHALAERIRRRSAWSSNQAVRESTAAEMNAGFDEASTAFVRFTAAARELVAPALPSSRSSIEHRDGLLATSNGDSGTNQAP